MKTTEGHSHPDLQMYGERLDVHPTALSQATLAPENAQKAQIWTLANSPGELGSAWVEVSGHLVDRVIDIYMVVIWGSFLTSADMHSTFFGALP